MKFHKIADNNFAFWCPGCDRAHQVWTAPGQWIWNGSIEKPTTSPSLKVTGHEAPKICHFFIKDGFMQFCGDSQHALAGKTVEIPDWKV